MFKRILIPVDGSERAEQALPIAARLARHTGGTVILLQVVEFKTFSLGSLTHPSPLEISLNETKQYLSEAASLDVFKDIPIAIHHPFGSVTSQILSVADSSGADSIVLSSQGHTGMTQGILGSVAESVIRHASLPVLLLQDTNAPGASLESDVEHPLCALVPLDGSFLAKAALEPAALLASALAAPAHATLHLTRVVKTGKNATAEEQRFPLYKAERYLKTIADQLREELTAHSEAPNLNITWSVTAHQDAAEGIIGAAEHGEHARGENFPGACDMIAMVTNGRSGLQRWVMGSVTESVLAGTSLPLLVVRPTEKTGSSETPEREFPLTKPGSVSTRKYLMAIIDDLDEAQHAVEALQQAKIPPEDIRLFERHEIIEYAEHNEQTRGLRSRIAEVFQAVLSDEDAHVLVYVQEALRGHAILNVYAPTSEQAERITTILIAHHARLIKHFGRWGITIMHH